MIYRITMVRSEETGSVVLFILEHRKWWNPFWKPVLVHNMEGKYDNYKDAVAAIGRSMVSEGIVRTKEVWA